MFKFFRKLVEGVNIVVDLKKMGSYASRNTEFLGLMIVFGIAQMGLFALASLTGVTVLDILGKICLGIDAMVIFGFLSYYGLHSIEND